MNSSSRTALKTVVRLWQFYLVNPQTPYENITMHCFLFLNSRFSLGQLGVPQMLRDIVGKDILNTEIAETRNNTSILDHLTVCKKSSSMQSSS